MKRNDNICTENSSKENIICGLTNNSMYEFLVERASFWLEETAIVYEGKYITYYELIKSINMISNSLLSLGIGKGDIVSIAVNNCPEAIAIIYAINRIGAIANILHSLLPKEELQHFVESTKSKALFLSEGMFERISGISWNTCPLIICYKFEIEAEHVTNNFNNKEEIQLNDKLTWDEFLELSICDITQIETDPDETALILYSGGTMGKQKGICLTNRNINSYAILSHEIAGRLLRVRSLAVLPIFHGFGLCSGIHNMLTCCSCVFLVPYFKPEVCNKLIFKEKIEVIFGVPAIYESLIHSDEIRKSDCSFFKLLYCGGDQLSVKTENRINTLLTKQNSHVRILTGYGLTECVAGCMSNTNYFVKEGTVGIPYPDIDMKIVEPGTDNQVPIDVPGELCLCGPTVMKGYYNDEVATKKALRLHSDNRVWLHTGDEFSVDKEGFYTFHNRLGRMLVVNGYNVYPEMIENALQQIQGISKSCVIGKKAKAGGDMIIGVVSVNDSKLTSKSIIKKCKEIVPEYAVPHQIRIWDQLPLTKVGKVDHLKVFEEINGV